MKIDLSSIDREQFNVDDRFLEGYGPVVLIVPTKVKHSWEASEFHLRSLLCDPDGTIVSSGFPKFLNYSERPELDKITDSFIKSGQVCFPVKMDGSLIIRDVLKGIDGEFFVNFRTRGCHNLGDFHKPVMDLVKEKYPKLLDPTICSHASLLFEYTSPDNRIIVMYDDSSLTLLGGMTHSEDKLPRFIWDTESSNKAASEILGVKPLSFYHFSNDPKEIIESVKAWPDLEGIVVWGHGHENGEDFTHMSKIKAWDYIRLHSLKFAFSGNKLRKLCYAANIEDLESLKTTLFQFGVDWETVALFRPDFEEYIVTRNSRRDFINSFIEEYRASGLMDLPTRKDVAIQTKAYCEEQGMPKLFGVCMSVAIGHEDKIQRFVEAYSLEIKPASLEHFRESGKSLLEGLMPYMEMLKERESGDLK